jgi:hypothetical protein
VGIGAALVLLGVGGAAAVLATPAAFRVGPADDSGPLTPSVTSTIITTTPSIAERPAPSDTPSMLPPAMITTTAAIVIAPTTTYDSGPTQEPVITAEPEPSTEVPITTRPKPTTKRTEPSQEETVPLPNVEPPPEAPPEPSTPKTKPSVSMPKVPPQQQGPDCPPQNPECNGGGGPVFS